MTDGLATVRILYLAVLTSTVILGIVVVVMAMTDAFGDGPAEATWAVAGVAIVGIAATVVSTVASPELDCTTPQRLAGTFRTRFIIRLALAEAPMLAAFVAALVSANPLVYLAGAPFAVVGFARAAPSRANLEREQDELVMRGCATTLEEALRGP